MDNCNASLIEYVKSSPPGSIFTLSDGRRLTKAELLVRLGMSSVAAHDSTCSSVAACGATRSNVGEPEQITAE